MNNNWRERLVTATVYLGERLLWQLEKLIARASLVGDRAFFEPREFPWVESLEREWRTIRAELDDVLAGHQQLPNFQDISVDQRALTDDDNWKTYFLFGYGFRSDANCARCPRTARLCEQIPGMKTAFFSILSPHKSIPAHRGPYKGVLRYHLGLVVPDGDLRIRVDREERRWQEGGSLIFDDTYEHEVHNNADGIRVVLFVDFVRPLRFPLNLLNAFVLKAIALSPFIGDAKRRQLDWERRFTPGSGSPEAATASAS